MNLCHARKKKKHVKAATLVRGSVLLGCSERGNYISQNPWGLSNRKGRESKQKSKSPGHAETTSRRVMENKNTSRGLDSVTGWLINISTKPASPLFSLFELHPIFFAIPAGAIVNPHSSPPAPNKKKTFRKTTLLYLEWLSDWRSLECGIRMVRERNDRGLFSGNSER